MSTQWYSHTIFHHTHIYMERTMLYLLLAINCMCEVTDATTSLTPAVS